MQRLSQLPASTLPGHDGSEATHQVAQHRSWPGSRRVRRTAAVAGGATAVAAMLAWGAATAASVTPPAAPLQLVVPSVDRYRARARRQRRQLPARRARLGRDARVVRRRRRCAGGRRATGRPAPAAVTVRHPLLSAAAITGVAVLVGGVCGAAALALVGYPAAATR